MDKFNILPELDRIFKDVFEIHFCGLDNDGEKYGYIIESNSPSILEAYMHIENGLEDLETTEKIVGKSLNKEIILKFKKG